MRSNWSVADELALAALAPETRALVERYADERHDEGWSAGWREGMESVQELARQRPVPRSPGPRQLTLGASA